MAELGDWARERGSVPATHRYGDHADHEADLLMPDGPGPHPLAVLLHGGFWRARFTRAVMAALAVDLAARGWASWNVEYRRVGTGGGVPETIDDVHRALERLASVEGPFERSRLTVIGHSAGGQLALCVADVAEVARVVSLAGVCDLVAAARQRLGEGAALEFTGGSPEERADAYARADPLRHVPAPAEVLLAHGDRDDRVPPDQSRRYCQAARAAGGACELLELPGADHFALIDPRDEAWQAVAARLDGF
jgi:acetyl esterase/lipase